MKATDLEQERRQLQAEVPSAKGAFRFANAARQWTAWPTASFKRSAPT